MKKILFVIAAITMIACGTKKEQSVADVIATNNIKEINKK